MTTPTGPRRLPTNPFATRFVRPGVLPPLDEHGGPVNVARLLESLPGPGRIAAIVGPHGHGKTTLLTAVARETAGTGRPVTQVCITGPTDVWQALVAVGQTRPGGLVCVDGWERMRFGTAAAARWLAGRKGVGILVTTHAAGRLPVFARCASSPALLAAIVDRVPDHGGRIRAADIDAAHRLHRGDIREALYELYDRFEDRVRGGAAVRI